MTHDAHDHDELDSDCLQAFDHIYAYLCGEIEDKATLALVEHHLAHCQSCYTRAQMEKQLNERLQKSGKTEAPKSLRRRLDKLLDDF